MEKYSPMFAYVRMDSLNGRKNPAVRDLICQDYVSPEERERRMREIFGRSPKSPAPAEPAAPDGTESNLVKPSQTKSEPIQLNQTS
jgi:hypothetical protein